MPRIKCVALDLQEETTWNENEKEYRDIPEKHVARNEIKCMLTETHNTDNYLGTKPKDSKLYKAACGTRYY